MKTLSFEKKLLLSFLLIGLLCAAALCGIRMGLERRDDAVCIAMSPEDLAVIAGENGLPDAAAAAEAIGVQIMEYEMLLEPGMLVEDHAQFSYDPAFGAYVPDGVNTRVFLVEGEYAARYATLGSSGAKPLEDMLYRAVTERNLRLVYLRLFTTADGTAITRLSDYRETVSGLETRIAAHGLHLSSSPSGFAPYTPQLALLYLTAVGVLCGALWLLLKLFPKVGRRWIVVLLLLGAAAAGAMLRFAPVLFVSGVAFAAAVIAPCLSAAYMFPRLLSAEGDSRGAELWSFARTLLIGLAVSLAGGMMVAALQSGSGWLLAADNFRGVKLSQALPLLFAALLALRDICRPKELLAAKKSLLLPGVLIVAVGAAFFLLRTGNAAAAVSVAEQNFRSWLENILIVRPRTKEFLVGWPCLALALACLRWDRRRLALPFAVFSTVAVSSVVNTFCHSRAPVWLSLTRSVLGALLGCAIGMVLLCLLHRRKQS